MLAVWSIWRAQLSGASLTALAGIVPGFVFVRLMLLFVADTGTDQGSDR